MACTNGHTEAPAQWLLQSTLEDCSHFSLISHEAPTCMEQHCIAKAPRSMAKHQLHVSKVVHHDAKAHQLQVVASNLSVDSVLQGHLHKGIRVLELSFEVFDLWEGVKHISQES
eukprot:297172-Pelagomonas_calceolata.AAC.4